MINSGPLAGLRFSQNGALAPFNHGTPTGSGGAQIGGDGGYFTTTSAFGGQFMDQAFGRFDYDFTDDVKGYAEVAATTVLNLKSQSNTQSAARAIGYNNAYLSTLQPDYRALLPASLQSGPGAIGTINAAGSFNFSKIFNQLAAFPAPQQQNTGNSITVLTGLTGSWGKLQLGPRLRARPGNAPKTSSRTTTAIRGCMPRLTRWSIRPTARSCVTRRW